MRTAGFEYQVASDEHIVDPPLDPSFAALLDIDKPEENGFSITSTQVDFAFDDPNLAQLSGMSEIEGEAWQEERRRCARASWSAVNGEWFETVSVLREDFAAVEERIAADARVLEIEKAWAVCLNDLGHGPFDSVLSLVEFVATKNFSWVTEASSTMAEQSRVTLSDDAKSDLDELLDFERALAVDAVDCARPFEEEYISIREPYLLEFEEIHPEIPNIPQ